MKKAKRPPLWRLLFAVFVLLFGVAIVVTSIIRINNSPNQKFEPAPVITRSVDEPVEMLPEEAGYVWRGQANDPKKITISSLGVDALIQNVGIDQNSEIAVPNNIHIAGWFVDSVRPGDRGLSIIDGHVNGQTNDNGVFKKLPDLKPGDKIAITFGDDSIVSFEVHSNQSVATADAATILYSQIPEIEKQLSLITCTGNFDKTSQTYANRQITILKAI